MTADKRLLLYKGLRDKFLSGLKADQEQESRARMEELNKKIEALERAQRMKEMTQKDREEAREAQRGEQNKGFLGGIKSF